jgi:uncharacterized protein YjbI with pentapeptide repeats
MNQEETWSHFITNYAQANSLAKILQFEDEYWLRRDEFVPEFLESLRQICLKIRAMQLNKKKTKISNITYSILRTGLIKRQPAYLIEAFDKDWFWDFVECHVKYYPTWAFRNLQQLENELAPKVKLYLNQIKNTQMERYLLQEANKYHQYVIAFIRYAMPQAVRLPEFQAIEKEAKFAVRVGEYLDKSEIVYHEDHRSRESAATKTWMQSCDGLAYTYEVFTNLDLSEGDYWGINLKYADLSGSNLSRSRMQFCTLTGAKLNQGSLAGSDLSESLIFEADFSECDMRGADFTKANGAAGIDDRANWVKPGFGAVNFRGANLEGANFQNANLYGAIFSGAHLFNVNFEGTILTNAVFSTEFGESINLTEEQRQQIVWR